MIYNFHYNFIIFVCCINCMYNIDKLLLTLDYAPKLLFEMAFGGISNLALIGVNLV